MPAIRDISEFRDKGMGSFCFTSTEARWLIRDGDRETKE